MDDATNTPAVGDRSAERDRSKARTRDQPFDVALGARICTLRVAADMSQSTLGQAVGVSFQQVQKYELGKDRVTVGTLKAIADALGVHPNIFFDGDMPIPSGSGPRKRAAVKAGAVLQKVRDPHVQDRLLDLAKVLSECHAGDKP